jgi:hypothetical protein
LFIVSMLRFIVSMLRFIVYDDVRRIRSESREGTFPSLVLCCLSKGAFALASAL